MIENHDAELARLEALRVAKFHEINVMIAASLGLGDFDTLSDMQKQHVVQEFTKAIEQWEAEMEPRPVTTPLQRLLREYHFISEQIEHFDDD